MNKILTAAAATALLTVASGAATPAAAAEAAVEPVAKAMPVFFAWSHTGYVYSAAFPAPAKKK